jgi:hypothetical protein
VVRRRGSIGRSKQEAVMRARLLALSVAILAIQVSAPAPVGALQLRTTAEPPPQLIGTRVHADGRPERFEYMANFGRDIMVTGIPEYDAVTLRKVDDLTSDAVLSHAGTVYGVARRTVAADGKTMTITFDRKSTEARIHNVAVYDKVSN